MFQPGEAGEHSGRPLMHHVPASLVAAGLPIITATTSQLQDGAAAASQVPTRDRDTPC